MQKIGNLLHDKKFCEEHHMNKSLKKSNREERKLIKQHAQEEGLKYSTFIKSVLHKYVTGQLVVRSKSAAHS
jgi:predicted DNA binding CopG/RHH family protein